MPESTAEKQYGSEIKKGFESLGYHDDLVKTQRCVLAKNQTIFDILETNHNREKFI